MRTNKTVSQGECQEEVLKYASLTDELPVLRDYYSTDDVYIQ